MRFLKSFAAGLAIMLVASFVWVVFDLTVLVRSMPHPEGNAAVGIDVVSYGKSVLGYLKHYGWIIEVVIFSVGFRWQWNRRPKSAV